MPADVLAGLRILLLEDEFLIAMDVEQLCRDNGAADVFIKKSLSELDGPLPEFDVAVVDLMMSGESTLPFARRLREARLPFIFASGYVDNIDLVSEFQGVPVVDKPYSTADLVNAILAVAGRKLEQ